MGRENSTFSFFCMKEKRYHEYPFRIWQFTESRASEGEYRTQIISHAGCTVLYIRHAVARICRSNITKSDVWSISVRHRPRLADIRSVPHSLLYAIARGWWKSGPCLIFFCTLSPAADGNQDLACRSPSVRHGPRLMKIMSVSDPLLYAIARGWWKSDSCLIPFCLPSPEANGN
jgi:hypothetical protein